MAQPYVGEIRMFAGNFAPAGWMFCEGQLLPISEYETLFNLIGTTYGGDGQSTFALPDLRGRVPIHFGNGFTLAETGGVRDCHADRVADSGAQPRVRWDVGQRHSHRTPTDNCPGAAPGAIQLYQRGADHIDHGTSGAISSDRRQPAARQLPALPLRRLHHFAVRDLPVPDLRRDIDGSVRRRNPHLPLQLRARRAGRSATARFCRSRRIRRCSRCSARPTAATARATSPCPTCRATRRCIRPGSRPVASRPRRDRRIGHRHVARIGNSLAQPPVDGKHQPG